MCAVSGHVSQQRKMGTRTFGNKNYFNKQKMNKDWLSFVHKELTNSNDLRLKRITIIYYVLIAKPMDPVITLTGRSLKISVERVELVIGERR